MIPIRILIPGVLLSFSAAFLGIELVHALSSSRERVARHESGRLIQRMTELQNSLDTLLRMSPLSGAREQIAYLGVDPEIEIALLFDPDGRVLASTRFELQGRGVSEAWPSLNDPVTAEILRTARERLKGVVRPSASGDALIAAYPVQMPSDHLGLGDAVFAMLFVQQDLRFSYATERSLAIQDALRSALPLLVVSAFFWILLTIVITRRSNHLTRSIENFARDGSTIPAGPVVPSIGGVDEIARIASSVNALGTRMATLTRSEHEARERTRFLLNLIQELMKTPLDLEKRFVRLAEHLVPDTCDWCVLDLVGDDGRLSREIAYHPDPTLLARLKESWRAHKNVSEESSAMASPVGYLEPSASLAIPLQPQNEPIGVLVLGRSRPRPPFSPEEIREAEATVRVIELALKNAQLYQKSEQAVRARDEFLSVASHELKTPITSLKLQLQLLDRELTKGVEGASGGHGNRIDVALRQLGRLVNLIENLLDVTRLRSGRLHLERRETNLSELVREVAARAEGDARASGARIELALTESVTGSWDPMRIEQVLTNLLSNAIKYGNGGRIWISVTGTPETATVTFRDEGIGIDPLEVPRLFQRFERGVESKAYSGLGLGLYIAQQIIHAHGGTIDVESEPGRGSTFRVVIPR